MGLLASLLAIVVMTLAGTMIFSLAMFIKQSFLNNSVYSEKTTGTTTSEKSSVTCLKCGQTLLEEYTFCPFCGQRKKERNADSEINLSEPNIKVESNTIASDEQELQDIKASDVAEINYDLQMDMQNAEQSESDDVIKDDVDKLNCVDWVQNHEGISYEAYRSFFNILQQDNENIVDGSQEEVKDNIPMKDQKSQKNFKNKQYNRKHKNKE